MNEIEMGMHATTVHPEIRVLISEEYPYAAWYDKESWDKKDWEGYWFANECPYLDLYIPAKESPSIRTFGFAHELGHAKDYIQNRPVWDKISNKYKGLWFIEVSAWVQAKRFLDELGYEYKPKELQDNIFACLKTYKRTMPQDETLLATVQRIMADKIPPITDQKP